MTLLIDIGNSRIKWAHLVDSTLHDPRAATYKKFKPESLFSGGRIPEQAYIANVAGRQTGDLVAAAVKKSLRLSPVFVKVQRRSHGVTCAYRDLTRLGIDRWLAAVAAWNRYRKAVCVVNCGTAMTIDAVSNTGRHLGGFIVPGLNLMRVCLNHSTSGINIPSGRSSRKLEMNFGRATEACVNNGTALTLVSLIEHVAAEMTHRYGKRPARVITGGDGARINACLAQPFDHDPHLVLHGLALLAGSDR